MVILGIETSCDDTGIAIIETSDKKQGSFKILSNIVSSQIKVHQKYGGIVPSLAAREHLKNIEPCLKRAFKKANIKPKNIDLIAVTIGPGLIPSLLVGVNFAKALSYAWQKPIIGINHIEGHIVAAFGGENSKFGIRNSEFLPALALVVSGGHTQLVLIKKIGDYKIIGETRDDAAGECFDKVARLLGLSYPGGPAIARMAIKSETRNLKSETNTKYKILNSKYKIILPRPMINQNNYDFSFSGLKTAVLYLVKDITSTARPQSPSAPALADATLKNKGFIQSLCRETQQAIIDVLIDKTIRAAKEYKVKTIILSGGVAANDELRQQFKLKIQNSKFKIQFLVPTKNLCTDNGVMIAMAGYFGAKRRPDFSRDKSWKNIKANANLRI